jgi:ligand-binding sensor domain-containing protein/AraC-like DNA-binding protein
MERQGRRLFCIAWQLLTSTDDYVPQPETNESNQKFLWGVQGGSFYKKRPPGRRRQNIFISVLMIILFWGRLWALDSDRPVEQYLVDSWQISDGIPSDEIRSIAQTPDGYLWIATSKSLVRFDGLKFSIIGFTQKDLTVPQKTIIPDTLCVDEEGTLWIGSAAGLTSYRHKTGQFKTYTAADGITNDSIRSIKDDVKGNLWISFHSSYLDRFTNGKFTAFNPSHGLEGNKINSIIERINGNLLFSTRETGVFTYKDEKFFKYPIKGLENLQIITMYEDTKAELWIGTNNGLFRVTDKNVLKYTAVHGLSHDFITYITEDSNRNLWVGTLKGLNRIKKRPDNAIGLESLLKPFMIRCLYEDKEKSLWIGTEGSGIKRLKDGKFLSYEPPREHQEEIFFSLLENQQGDTWIGMLDGKLSRCRGSDIIESVQIPGVPGTAVFSIAEDAKGNLWLGTNGKGIFQKKNSTFFQFTTREGLADNVVVSISRDKQGNLWLSTFDGVSIIRRDNSVIESFKSKDGLLGKRVNNINEDNTGNIWIASDKGITVLKNGKITKENIAYHLKDVPATCIHEDPDVSGDEDRVYWIATHGGGLKRLKDGTVTSYTTAEGMTTDFLYQFFKDEAENFWFMSDSGVLRVNKNELERFAGNEVDSINCTSFGISDGMKSLEFNNKFSRHSALKTRNGEFWFITKKGITIMNPEKIQINKVPPPVVIESVFFNRQSILLHHDAETNAFKGMTDFRFHFTAPTFLSPGKVKFKYQLEGVDREWVSLPLGSDRAASYKDLDPGTYTFKVIACNSDGVWNRTGDSKTFTLKPFFYQTGLFKIAIIVFIFIVAAVVVFFLYKRQPLKKQPVDEQVVDEQDVETQPVEEQKKNKGAAAMNPQFVKECITKLKYQMEIEKAYHDENISLRSLAKKLSIPYYQLSQVLNEELGQNFSDYINFHRVEEAKEILADPKKKDLKIDAVASEVGYNTRVAFYRVFKKSTNMTPSQYRKAAGTKK